MAWLVMGLLPTVKICVFFLQGDGVGLFRISLVEAWGVFYSWPWDIQVWGLLRGEVSGGKDQLSNETNPGCLVYIGDEKLPSYMGIKIHHYKDPVIKQPV